MIISAPSPNKEAVQQVADAIRFPIYLCMVQPVIMVVGSTIFLLSNSASKLVRDSLGFLESLIPTLSRYGSIFSEEGRAADFNPFFSIYVFFILLQLIMLSALMAILYWHVKDKRPALGFFKSLIFLAFLLFLAFPTIDLIFGLSDLRNPGLWGNGALHGDYLTSVYIYCLLLPVFNFLFYFCIYGVYSENHFQKLESRTRVFNVKNER